MKTDPCVLVVEDDPDVRDSLAMVLESQGYRVATAYDGVEALAFIAGELPCAVVVDLVLPRLGGIELARAIRSTHGAAIVLVGVTGWDSTQYRAACHAAGLDHVLMKPVDLPSLLALLPAPPPGRDTRAGRIR